MHIDALLPRQSSSCISCPDPIPCNCSANQDCIQINRDCSTCSKTQCVAKSQGSDSSGGASKGATAGAIVGALVFLGIAIYFFLWYRRRLRIRQCRAAARESPQDIPASAETVLNRPDPTEKYLPPPTEVNHVRVYSNSNTTIDLDPDTQRSSPRYNTPRRSNNNPFDDATSIQTAGTEGTNVIPIALVPAETQRSFSPSSTGHSQLPTGSSPVRPVRSPDLYLDHVNVSSDSVRPPAKYALSTRSGISGFTNRNSFGSNASFSSDLLNEAPMIITPNKGAVRQVLGVVKAEVINAPGSLPSGSDSLKPPNTRPLNKSPLASTSFGPTDMNKEDDAQHIDPFRDDVSIKAEYGVSPTPTTSTFVRTPTTPARESQQSEWVPDVPNMPWTQSDDASRPSSISTQSDSVIDIASATRVHVGLNGGTRAPYRRTMGRLISPSTPNSASMQDQQQRVQAQAQAQTQVSDVNRRVSSGSAMSATSTRADSILEFFPFVPPSPISDRPVRSPPVSPLAQQSFNSITPPSPISSKSQHVIKVAPPSPLTQEAFSDNKPANTQANVDDGNSLPLPPSRQTLGMSTGSQLSTSSSGLGSFPFQIETGESSAPPSSFNNRQRASLDTLALTSDLSSYPLGFDRDSVQVPMPSTSTHKS